MNKLIFILCLSLACPSWGQTSETKVGNYLTGINNNTAALTAFFSAMPKGGDLHHHFSGSVYAETYISYVVQQDFAINESTLEVREKAPANDKNWVRFSNLKERGLLTAFKQKLIQKWSVKDYNGISNPSDKQFFETFPAFNIANDGPGRLDTGLLELKRRAKSENVSYIETMLTTIHCSNIKGLDTTFNSQLGAAQANRDESKTNEILDKLYRQIEDRNAKACATAFNNDVVKKMHYGLGIDDSTFTMRYQNFVVRVIPPTDVFKNLIVAFESANTCSLIVGVNIVAPEDNEISMRDYWLHMQMYKYLHNKYPAVKYAMHAGELALGMVKPEELTWHINAAVRTAGASRIGHGVDLPYESKSQDLLKYMAGSGIPIEINLGSNEFILKVKNDEHPIELYRNAGVPIVICTDDAGVLRTNLTRQYVLLARRYQDIPYKEIKQFVFNSIDYSFIKEEGVKEGLKEQLRKRFQNFENDVIVTHKL